MLTTSRAFWLAGLVGLSACAPLSSTPPAPHPAQQTDAGQGTVVQVGRTAIVLPPPKGHGQTWQILPTTAETLVVQPAPVAGLRFASRALVLRDAGQQPLAVFSVQGNDNNFQREAMRWTAPCPRQPGVWVQDWAEASPVRADCLRIKRRAEHPAPWLTENHPPLAQLLSEHGLTLTQPHTYVGYRYATEDGAWLVVEAVVDTRLLYPQPRNNQEFLQAGQPAQQWANQLRQAVRQSVGMMDGRLSMPPFPLKLVD